MKKTIIIGALGLELRNPANKGRNLGCYALSYSFFEILSKIAEKDNIKIEVVVILPARKKLLVKKILRIILKIKESQVSYYKKLYPLLDFSIVYHQHNNFKIRIGKNIKRCNCVFDFTAGDSFTDLYGEDRFYTRTRIKKNIIDYGIPLILGSQTIGPFREPKVEKFAIDVIEHCKMVYVRDCQSKAYIESISNKAKPVQTIDVAFFLPFKKAIKESNRKKAGFNPSGLLWAGGYNGNNQFSLTVDYQIYCKKIIQYLIDSGYEVHLILHAFFEKDIKGYYCADNDRLAVDNLHALFPSTLISPAFETPMEAKSYISGMDLFIGARMHATIAAISVGIPVIPFSYSRKFEGLFSSLDYPFVIQGTMWSTNQSIDITEKWISKIKEFEECVTACRRKIEEGKTFMLNHYSMTINSLLS